MSSAHAPDTGGSGEHMHAALVWVDIAEGRDREAQGVLHDRIVPRAKGMPGFVAGYWTAVRPGEGFSMVVFDTEEHARAGVPPAGAPPVPGAPVTVRSVEIVEVVATGDS